MATRTSKRQAPGTAKKRSTAGVYVPLPAALIGLGLLAGPTAADAAGVATDDHYSVQVNSVLSGVNVLANDALDVNSSVQVFEITSPSHGNASVQMDGSLIYAPFNGFRGVDSFQYLLVNNGNATATVFLDVGAGPAPVPGLAPAGVAALAAGIAGLAMRRRRKT